MIKYRAGARIPGQILTYYCDFVTIHPSFFKQLTYDHSHADDAAVFTN